MSKYPYVLFYRDDKYLNIDKFIENNKERFSPRWFHIDDIL